MPAAPWSNTVWHEMFSGVYFCGLTIFLCLAGNLFLRFEQSGFSCWELFFAIFKKFPFKCIDKISVFIEDVQLECFFHLQITLFCKLLRYHRSNADRKFIFTFHWVNFHCICERFVCKFICLLLNERDVSIKQTWYLLFFLANFVYLQWSKFLREFLFFCGNLWAQLEHAKISCHAVWF